MYGSSLERSCAKLILVGETAVASVSREVLRGQLKIHQFTIYREFSPYANFITANFVTTVFQNHYCNLPNAILCAINFVTAFIN